MMQRQLVSTKSAAAIFGEISPNAPGDVNYLSKFI